MRTLTRVAFAIVAGAIAASNVFAQNAPAMVILVRHAEKASVGGSDPSLSELGQARAKALATTLNDAGVSAVITTTYKRTIETADALVAAKSLKVEKMPITGGTAQHVTDVVAAVRKHPGEVVLVVGHSNTIPAIVAALGGPKVADLCESNYASLFVVHMAKEGAPAHVVRSRYGAAEPEGSETCTTPMRF
ncbi:MAG: phosphoglycerate mutase family protein [Gemmatimonas sp.]